LLFFSHKINIYGQTNCYNIKRTIKQKIIIQISLIKELFNAKNIAQIMPEKAKDYIKQQSSTKNTDKHLDIWDEVSPKFVKLFTFVVQKI
jgi:hypothetical protein